MFKHMRTQWDGLKQSASLCGRSSLYNLLTLGEHISILHMKNEIQIWPKCGAFAILVDLFSFLLQVFSWSQVFCVSEVHCKLWVQTYGAEDILPVITCSAYF